MSISYHIGITLNCGHNEANGQVAYKQYQTRSRGPHSELYPKPESLRITPSRRPGPVRICVKYPQPGFSVPGFGRKYRLLGHFQGMKKWLRQWFDLIGQQSHQMVCKAAVQEARPEKAASLKSHMAIRRPSSSGGC